MNQTRRAAEPIAVVGIGCRLPGGVSDPEALWSLLLKGVDAVREIPNDRLDLRTFHSPRSETPGTFITRRGGFLDHVDRFAPEFFGISSREACGMDPQQRLLLEVAWEALEDAGIPAERIAGTEGGVFLGISTHDFSDIQFGEPNRELIDNHTATGGAMSIAANRISYVLDLRGPSAAIDTACSSSLTAVHMACRALLSDECTMALTGGVNLLLTAGPFIGFSKASMLSPDGRCKAFDARANGYVRAEGAGIIVLKRLSQARADGDRIYAVLLGTAVNQDGRSNGLTVPNGDAQAALTRTALEVAGIAARDVGYVEAHGTGTPVGDPIEAKALGTVLSEGRPDGDLCVVGSIKTNLGHLEAASGVAGLIKAILSVERRTIPASLHFVSGNPAIPFDALKLRVPTKTEPWSNRRAIACINSFGFGGANAHAIVAELPRDEVSAIAGPELQLLPVSAKNPDDLQAVISSYIEHLADPTKDDEYQDLAYCAGARRSHHEHRVAVLGRSREDLLNGLIEFTGGEASAGVFTGQAVRGRAPQIAFVCSGMGPQWWGMGRELFATEPAFRATIERCDALLRPETGWSLIDEMRADETLSRMEETEVAQPANFALQVALAALWRSWGVEPAAIVGHSAGEAAAAHLAGALGFEEAIRLVFHRSRLQQRTAGEGRMIAVQMPVAEIMERLGHLGVEIAAVNGTADVTLCVETSSIDAVINACEFAGIYHRLLRGRVPYHGRPMDRLRSDLFASLEGLSPRTAVTPLVSSVTGDLVHGSELNADYWWHNVRHPVQFAAAVDALIAARVDTFLELSPHPVLGSAVAARLAERKSAGRVLYSLKRQTDERETLLSSLAALYTAGQKVDWNGLHQTSHLGRRRFVRLPGYPWQRERHWRESGASRQERIESFTHPLLGQALPTAKRTWESLVDLNRLPFLADHRVQGAVVYPAAAYVEMALACARRTVTAADSSATITLESFEIQKALFVTEGDRVVAQTACDADESHFEIHAQAGADQSWSLKARGRFLKAAAADRHIDLAALNARCAEEIPVPECYARLWRLGLEYGPAFQGIEQLRRGKGEAVAIVSLPEAADAGADDYVLHPSVLDGTFQVLIGATLEGKTSLYLPVRIERLRLYRAGATRVHVHARVRLHTAKLLVGDIALFDETGQTIAEITGFRCQGLRSAAQSAADELLKTSLYRLEWRPAAAQVSDSAAVLFPSASDIESQIDSASVLDKAGQRAFEFVQSSLDALASDHVAQAFEKLGLPRMTGTFGTGELASKLGVHDRHRRLLGRLVTILEKDGIIKRAGATQANQWQLADLPPARKAITAEAILDNHPDAHEVVLVDRCGKALAGVLRGDVEPLELLFPRGSVEEASHVYEMSPSFFVYNALVRRALATALRDISRDATVRVLEVGAGTGGTTAGAVAELQRVRAQYVATDASPLFASHFARKFKAHPWVEFKALDIERDPQAQGFEAGSFDIVIAADVLHATRDLRDTLSHVRKLLAPGGMLIALEVTRPPRWVDVVFGLTEGWFRFQDTELRPDSALLTPEAWLALLPETGFPEPRALTHGHIETPAPQTVLVAQRTMESDKTTALGNWLIVGDTTKLGCADTLAQHLADAGSVVRTIPSGLHVTADGVAAAIQDLLASRGGCRGIVDLGALDAREATLDVPVTSLVSVVQGLSLIPPSVALDLWIVTRGAQTIDPTSPAETPAIGVGRVVRNELPNVRTRLLDLDTGSDVQQILWELRHTGDEEEVAIRGNRRMVSRLVRMDPQAEAHPLSEEGTSARLTITTPGLLDGLHLRAMGIPKPGTGEVTIRIQAAGMNFRDVMLSMGLLVDAVQESSYFGEALGMECAGSIVAVGPGVDQWHVGDDVVAQGRACLATHTVTRADLVSRKPAHMTFEEAAAIPVAFVTAHYALNRLAQLAQGERILIHAATGGVGLAAVYLAQQVGAEIYATAGTDDKRRYLRSIGVKHVMNSRDLSFAEDVLKLTNGEGVDVVLNSLSGEAIPKSLSVLRSQGRFLEIGKVDIAADNRLAMRVFANNLSFFAIDIDRILHLRPTYAAQLFHEVMAFFNERRLPSLPSTVVPVSQARDAFRDMAQGKHMGKIVLSMDDPLAEVKGRRDTRIIRSDATYLITGGLGGFGLETAGWLVTQGARHLVLVGRQGAARPEAQAAVAALREVGADVRVASADVSDKAQVHALMEDIRSMPPLRGVLHAAMVLDDGYLAQLDGARIRRVLAPKALGAWNLHQGTLGCALDFFVMFSSVAATYGNPGQGNYVAANLYLDALAQLRRSQGLPAISIAWGALGGVGYLARHDEIGQFLDRHGLQPFQPEEATALLGELLHSKDACVVAARMDWGRWSKAYPASGNSPRFSELVKPSANTDDPEGGVSVSEALLRTPAADRPKFLSDYLADRVSRVLRTSAAKLSFDAPLTEQGLDSLMAVELMNQLEIDLDIAIPVTTLLQGPSIHTLAERLLEQVVASAGEGTSSSASSGYAGLVTLQGGGKRRPFFFVHPSSGEVTCYAELSSLLGPDQPFHAFEAPGIGGVGAPINDVVALARRYVEVLRAIQPEGPYLIGGYSMGGAIAFEIVQQLRKVGQQTALLALIDSPSPWPGHEPPDAAQLAAWFVKEMGGAFVSREELLALDEEHRLDTTVERIVAAGARQASRESVRRLLAVFAANIQALVGYAPESYHGPAIYFGSQAEPAEYFRGHPAVGHEVFGWNRWLSGPLEVHGLAGDHHSILSGEHAKAIARHLAAAAEKAVTARVARA
jgi:acyl transferase domain-containing protein/NADPH:quinone reductase-like Zn-dependent oxidoreductase/thioesterase domain-containing protein/NADP-dependent 3-hydroxy acid dehydrogenase YdfG/acyl carrier protein